MTHSSRCVGIGIYKYCFNYSMIHSCISTKFGQFGTVKFKVKMLAETYCVFFSSYSSQAKRSYRPCNEKKT